MKKRLITVMVIFFVTMAISASSLPTEYQKILKEMTLEEKVGQMLLLGVPGTSINSTAKAIVTELKAGGVVLFAANLTSISQATNFTSQLQEETLKTKLKIPLLITADEEGGLVSRLPLGMVTMPGNMALGASRNEHLTAKAYYHTGRQLRALGINMNLAPVLDVNNNPNNPVIGLRSFGSDPLLVGNMGLAAISGLKDAQVGSIVKHFPGHGDTGIDSHYALPIVTKSQKELMEMELAPFQKALAGGAKAVMTGHIEFPALTGGKKVPATLSSEILTDLLRANWGYTGVISTDDMTMKAITNYFGQKDAFVMAVKAGVDQLLIVGDLNNQRLAKQAIIDAVQRGEISEKRIDQSVERILTLKAELGLKPNKLPELLDPKTEAKAAEKIALEVGLQSITQLKDEGCLLQKGDRVLLAVVDSKLMGAAGRVGTTISYLLQQELKNRGFAVETVSLANKPSSYEQELVSNKAKECDIVIVLTRNAGYEQAGVIKRITHTPLITVALQNPYDILKYPDVKVHFITYGYTEASIKALAAILTKEQAALGQLPVTVSKTYAFGYKR